MLNVTQENTEVTLSRKGAMTMETREEEKMSSDTASPLEFLHVKPVPKLGPE